MQGTTRTQNTDLQISAVLKIRFFCVYLKLVVSNDDNDERQTTTTTTATTTMTTTKKMMFLSTMKAARKMQNNKTAFVVLRKNKYQKSSIWSRLIYGPKHCLQHHQHHHHRSQQKKRTNIGITVIMSPKSRLKTNHLSEGRTREQEKQLKFV